MLETILIIFTTLILSALFAKLSRMNGGGPPKLPLGLDAILYGLPFGIAGGILGATALTLGFTIPFTSIALSSATVGFIIAFVSGFLGKRLGHGQYFDLATFIGRKISAEKIDFLVKPFFGVDPLTQDPQGKTPFWRDFFGLSLTGLAVSLGLGILALLAGHVVWAIVLFVTGALKGVAYTIPLKYNEKTRSIMKKLGVKFDDDKGHTEPGEWINGFIQGAGVFAYLGFLVTTLI